MPDSAGAGLLALQWQLDQTECLPPEALRARQLSQVEALVVHAVARSPFWRARLEQAGWTPGVALSWETWRRLPVLSRAEAQAAGTALHALPTPAAHGKLTRAATSGSTGAPLTVIKTELSQFFWNGFLLREMLWQGWDAGRLAVIREDAKGSAPPPDGLTLPDWGGPIARLFRTGPAAMLDMRAPIEVQAAWLARQNPDILVSWPSNLAALAQHCLAQEIRPARLRIVRSFAETVTPALRTLCHAAWGAELVDSYSAEDAGYIALQCPGRPLYHIQSEGVLVEVLDEDGAPCAPGAVGRVVVTPLQNFAMPLLRYALGDDAEAGGPCPCGRGLPTLAKIVGRTRDRLVVPGAGRRFAYNPSEAFAAIPAIMRYQIAQVAPDVLEVRLVARGELNGTEQAAIADALAAAFRYRFVLRFTYHPALGSPGTKFRDVVCEIAD